MASLSGPLAQHSLHLSRPFQSGSLCLYCVGSQSFFERQCLQIGQSIALQQVLCSTLPCSKCSAPPCPTASALQHLALRGSDFLLAGFLWAEFCCPSCLADFCWPIFVGRIIRIAGPKCYAELSELLAKDRNVVNEIIGQELIAILIVHSLNAKSVHKTN